MTDSPALDLSGLRTMMAVITGGIHHDRAAGFRAVCEDALNRAELAAAMGDDDAALHWSTFVRQRLRDWSEADSLKTPEGFRPCSDAFMRQWKTATGRGMARISSGEGSTSAIKAKPVPVGGSANKSASRRFIEMQDKRKAMA